MQVAEVSSEHGRLGSGGQGADRDDLFRYGRRGLSSTETRVFKFFHSFHPPFPFPLVLSSFLYSLSQSFRGSPTTFLSLVCFITSNHGGPQDTSLGSLFSSLEQSVRLNLKGVSSWRRHCSHSWHGVQVLIIKRGEVRAEDRGNDMRCMCRGKRFQCWLTDP